MYRIYKNILHSFQGDFKILVKNDIFQKNYMAHFLESPGLSGRYHMYEMDLNFRDCFVRGNLSNIRFTHN